MSNPEIGLHHQEYDNEDPGVGEIHSPNPEKHRANIERHLATYTTQELMTISQNLSSEESESKSEVTYHINIENQDGKQDEFEQGEYIIKWLLHGDQNYQLKSVTRKDDSRQLYSLEAWRFVDNLINQQKVKTEELPFDKSFETESAEFSKFLKTLNMPSKKHRRATIFIGNYKIGLEWINDNITEPNDIQTEKIEKFQKAQMENEEIKNELDAKLEDAKKLIKKGSYAQSIDLCDYVISEMNRLKIKTNFFLEVDPHEIKVDALLRSSKQENEEFELLQLAKAKSIMDKTNEFERGVLDRITELRQEEVAKIKNYYSQAESLARDADRFMDNLGLLRDLDYDLQNEKIANLGDYEKGILQELKAEYAEEHLSEPDMIDLELKQEAIDKYQESIQNYRNCIVAMEKIEKEMGVLIFGTREMNPYMEAADRIRTLANLNYGQKENNLTKPRKDKKARLKLLQEALVYLESAQNKANENPNNQNHHFSARSTFFLGQISASVSELERDLDIEEVAPGEPKIIMETEKTTTVGHFQEIAGRKFLIKNKDISSGSKSKYLPISIGYDQANTIKTILLDREEDLVVINDKKIDNILSPGDILWDLEKIEEKFSMPSDGATRIRFELTLKTFSGSQTKETIDFWIDDKAPTIIKHDQDKVQLYEFNDRKEGSGVKSVTFHYLDDKGNAQQSTLENKGNENPWMIDINRESDIKITTVSAIDHSGNENISSFLN